MAEERWELSDPEAWSTRSFTEHRQSIADALLQELAGATGVRGVQIEAGTAERRYDFTAAAETDVGILRTPLWSHARAMIFGDASVHPANRRQLGPEGAVREAANRLRGRLEVPFALESRGLTLSLEPEEGVARTWTAERALFRDRTAVTREDRVSNAAGDLDVRDLLAHFYTGPSLRLVGKDGQAFLLPAASEAEGPLVALCRACNHWAEGSHEDCPECGGPVDVVIAARPTRR